MTVGELIDILIKHPNDMKVVTWNAEFETHVEDVTVDKQYVRPTTEDDDCYSPYKEVPEDQEGEFILVL